MKKTGHNIPCEMFPCHFWPKMIEENISLRPFNTFGINVQARYFAAFSTTEQLRELLAHEKVKASKQLVLGGGSNLLLTRDFDGVVLKNEIKGIVLILLPRRPEKYGIGSSCTASTPDMPV
jgi:hypothetical protein